MILYILLLICSLEASDSFCPIENCQENAIQINDILEALNNLTATVQSLEIKNSNLEYKNAQFEAEIARLDSENHRLKADVIEIQDKIGLRKLPPA